MYFTLAVSAATAAGCAALVRAAQGIDPRIMPVPGPAQVTWRAPGEHAAVLHWGEGRRTSASHAGTIWAEGAVVCARAARGTELFRRMTTRRLSLLRPAPAGAYLASLAPSAATVARKPLPGLDDFYLVNRAGRWSAAARQAYLLRSALVQPLFEDRVVRTARAVPLRYRMSDRLHRDVLALLCPELATLAALLSGDWLNARG